MEIIHKDGIPWFKETRPRRFHRCRAQTKGVTSTGNQIERCACGAARMNGGSWLQKNSRRKR